MIVLLIMNNKFELNSDDIDNIIREGINGGYETGKYYFYMVLLNDKFNLSDELTCKIGITKNIKKRFEPYHGYITDKKAWVYDNWTKAFLVERHVKKNYCHAKILTMTEIVIGNIKVNNTLDYVRNTENYNKQYWSNMVRECNASGEYKFTTFSLAKDADKSKPLHFKK